VCVLLELYDLVAILGSLGAVLGVVMYGIRRHNPQKTANKAGYDSIKTIYETYNTQVQDVLKIKDAQIKRLNAKMQQYEAPIEENSTKEPINLDSLAPILQQRGINPDLLKNPFVTKLIKKYTKGMGLDEILSIVDQFGLLKGNKQPVSSDPIETYFAANPKAMF